ANGVSFTWNSIDFGGSSYNLYVVSDFVPYMPKATLHIEKLAQTDGAVTQGSTWEPLTIAVRCIVQASSAANRITQTTNIIAALKTTEEGEKPFVLDMYPNWQWQARMITGLNAKLMSTGLQFPLSFFCANPWPTDIS
ncbi:hypothetical protein LCGC14_1795430, partial [marine sediment metagenome]